MFVINDKLKIFSIIGLIFSIIYAFIIFQNKVPFAHDTFQYLQLQYVYFNEIVQNHSIPIWFPFVGQGNTGNFIFTPQLNLLTPIYYLLGLVIKWINYQYLFYFLMWFEELFFLTGIILLSSLYYKDKRTIFFVSVTLLGTSIWYPQVWWNFHLFYFIPITLFCIHKCFITYHFRYLVFSIIFFTLTVYGNFIYCGIFTSFVVFIYVLLQTLTDFKSAKLFFKKNLGLKNGVILIILLSLIILSFYYVRYGVDGISYLGPARDSSGKNNLDTFLTYGGSIGLSKYKEIFIRYNDSIDINLYAGIFLMPFVLISLLNVKKKFALLVGGVSLVVFLFSIGEIVPHLFYYLYPFGKVFRHIGLTATVFKLFIVFYAGFGVENFLERMHTDRRLIFSILIYLIVCACMYIARLTLMDTGYFWFMSQNEKVYLLVSIYIVLFISIILFLLMYKTKFEKRFLFNALLALMVIDFFSYKYFLIVTRMPSAPETVISLFKPYKYEFPLKRLNAKHFNPNENERMQQFNSMSFRAATYSTLDTFTFMDFVKSQHRTDFLAKSIKNYLDVQKKYPNTATEIYKKYSGDGYPKLMVFSRLNVVENESVMGELFSRKNFTGDMLFTTNKDIESIRKGFPLNVIKSQNTVDFNNLNESIDADIQIEKFSFNMLKLTTLINGPTDEYCFLYYSDAYHPHWNAYVNSKETPVINANIGYKSIMIPYGTSEVIFEFGSLFYTISIFCSLLLLSVILCLTIYVFVTEFLTGGKVSGNKKSLPKPIKIS